VRSTGVHHVDLVVSAIGRSLPFYTELLGPLGYYSVSEVEGERGETIWYLSGPGTSIGLREATTESGPYDRYRVGLHHLAFEADRARRSTTGPPGCGCRGSRSRANRRSTRTCPATTRPSSTIPTV
jgi:catechol 2,3-dioxygenase-like lactoylglutathione lyase family enzyme